jgi:hypothetical protein
MVARTRSDPTNDPTSSEPRIPLSSSSAVPKKTRDATKRRENVGSDSGHIILEKALLVGEQPAKRGKTAPGPSPSRDTLGTQLSFTLVDATTAALEQELHRRRAETSLPITSITPALPPVDSHSYTAFTFGLAPNSDFVHAATPSIMGIILIAPC